MDWIKAQIKDSEIAFIQKKTPRKYRVVSLEEKNSGDYIEKYDTLPLEDNLEGFAKGQYKFEWKMTTLNFVLRRRRKIYIFFLYFYFFFSNRF